MIFTRVETNFLSTMELDTEKVSRDFSLELATTLPYFHVMLGMEVEDPAQKTLYFKIS